MGGGGGCGRVGCVGCGRRALGLAVTRRWKSRQCGHRGYGRRVQTHTSFGATVCPTSLYRGGLVLILLLGRLPQSFWVVRSPLWT